MTELPPQRSTTADVLAHYALGQERDRLTRPRGIIEFERTKELILRRLPPPPAAVADIGGGPGRYALWLAESGYHVHHRDLADLHVEQLRDELRDRRELLIETAVGDARQVDLPDRSVDVVLLLGPLYHLPQRRDRLMALREAARILIPGGCIFASAISRWGPRLDAVVGQKLYEKRPEVGSQLERIERTGWLPPLFPGSFTGYCHRPDQFRAEIRAAGFTVVSVAGLEGVHYLLADLAERVGDPTGLTVLLDAARALESVSEVIGVSPHFLATAVLPA